MASSPSRLLYVACWVVGLGAGVVPFWTGQWLPLQDLPGHQAMIAILAHWESDRFAYQDYYSLELGSTTYLSVYLLGAALAKMVGVDAASRVLLTGLALSLPLSLAAYLRATGHRAVIALVAVPLLFNPWLFHGFLNYLMGWPLFLAGMSLWLRGLGRPGWRGPTLAIVAVVLFFTHLQMYLLLVGACGWLGLWSREPWRDRVRLGGALIPGLVVLGVWLATHGGIVGGGAWDAALGQRWHAETEVHFAQFPEQFTNLPDHLFQVYSSIHDDVLGWVMVVLVACWAIWGAAHLGRGTSWRRRAGPVGLAFIVWCFALFLPTQFGWISPVSSRLAPLALLLTLVAGPVRLGPRITTAAAIGLAVLAIAAGLVHRSHFEAFDAEVGQLGEVVETVPLRSRVRALIYEPRSQIVTAGAPLLHIGQTVQVRRGGVTVFNFAEAPQSPIHQRPQDEGGPPPTPIYAEWHPEDFPVETAGGYYDVLLTRSAPGPGDENARRERLRLERHFGSPTTELGTWRVYSGGHELPRSFE